MSENGQKVALIAPPLTLEDRYGKDMKHFGAVTEPLGIAYIAGVLESSGVSVFIFDAPAEGLNVTDVCEKIDRFSITLVGITLLTPSFGVVKDLCDQIKLTCPDVVIVLGGPHCTALPERTLAEISSADLVCFGEGELTMKEVVQSAGDRRYDAILGLCWRNGEGDIVKNPPRPYIKEIDSIPMPARHLLPMDKYHLTASRVEDESYCPTIIVARGCPFGCSYCSHNFGRKIRFHSVERIMSEIHFLVAQYHISQINLEADTLTTKKGFVEELCHALIQSGLTEKLKWTCESRVDTVTEEMLHLMKRAGCWQISYGIETGSQRLLTSINKGISLEQVEKAVQATHRAGISVRGFFMLGLPGESPEESRQTIDFAIRLNPRWAQFTITIPYPGTPMFENLDQGGKIRHHNWAEYNTWSGWKEDANIPFIADGRTLEELLELQKAALRKFYFRPLVFARFLFSIKSVDEFKKYATGFFVLVKSWFK